MLPSLEMLDSLRPITNLSTNYQVVSESEETYRVVYAFDFLDFPALEVLVTRKGLLHLGIEVPERG